MFKPRRWVAFILAIIVIFGTSACSSSSKSAKDGSGKDSEQIVITYSDADQVLNNFKCAWVNEVLFPEILKQTNNKVKIDAHFGGALLSTQEVLAGLGNGVADIAFVGAEPYPDKLYGFSMYYLFPQVGDKWDVISEIFDESIGGGVPILEKQLKDNNQFNLVTVSPLPITFAATYEWNDLQDTKGKKWRAASPIHLAQFKNIGAITVSVPFEDVYSSLQTNLIDGVLSNYGGLHSMKFYEVAKNVIVAPQLWYPTPFMFNVNLDFWNSLPKDVQEGITKAAEIAGGRFGEYFEKEVGRIIADEKSKGATVKIATDEQVAAFVDEKLMEELRTAWIERIKKEYKDENGKEYLDKMKTVIANAQAKYK